MFNYKRIRDLGFLLTDIKGCIAYLVRIDPQFWAVSEIVGNVKPEVEATSIIMNALVSYRLKMPGEKYWMLFSVELIREKPSKQNILLWFNSLLQKHNPLSMKSKISRLEKFRKTKIFHQLSEKPVEYCFKLGEFNLELGRVYGDPYAKTIVFATKMYYYYCLAKGFEPPLDYNIVFPVDRRNALLTYTLGLIRRCRDIDESKCIELLMSRYRRQVINAWDHIARFSGIPPLILDTITWIAYGNIDAIERVIVRIPNQYCRDIVKNVIVKLYSMPRSWSRL